MLAVSQFVFCLRKDVVCFFSATGDPAPGRHDRPAAPIGVLSEITTTGRYGAPPNYGRSAINNKINEIANQCKSVQISICKLSLDHGHAEALVGCNSSLACARTEQNILSLSKLLIPSTLFVPKWVSFDAQV